MPDGNGTSGNFGRGNYLLKDDVKTDWYVYRAGDGAAVRPYPVFDAAGNICPVVNMLDPENPYSVFSEAFAIVPLVTYAGVDGSLQFVDYCPDADSYLPPGTQGARTPYEYLVRALYEMLPERDKTTTKSGNPTPTQLLTVQRNIHYSTPALLCRAAILQTKSQRSKSKHAVDGIFFKGIFYVATKSALESTLQLFQTPKDPRAPWSPTNNQLQDLFELDGVALSYRKAGADNQSPVSCSVSYDPAYAPAATKAFAISNPAEYHGKVREMFGPNQNLSDIIRILSVAEMVSILKEHYPISWVYYALKDSPYATLLTPQDRETALSDPEMGVWFGMPGAQPQQYPTAAPAAAPMPATHVAPSMPVAAGYPAPSTAYPPSPAPGYPQQQPPAAYPTQAPSWAPAGSSPATGMPMGPGDAAAPAAVSDRLAYWQNKYGAGSSTPAEEDGIRM